MSSSLNTGSTDLRDTEVQQPKTTETLSLAISSLRLFGEQRPVRGGIDDHRLELLAEHAAFLVLLVDQHQHDVFQRRLADRHRAGERVKNADLDRVLGARGDGAQRDRAADQSAGRAQHKTSCH